MATSSPLVSVVVPTFNRPELVARALRSVLAQTFTDYEIVVVDDGDKIGARDVVGSFHDPRIRYLKNDPPKRGGGATRNVGISESKGKYVAFLDDDDEWLPEKLALQLEEFTKTAPDVGFSVTSVSNTTDNGEVVNRVVPGVRNFLPIILIRFKGFLTSSLVVRRSVFADVGMFDASLPSHQEIDLLLRIGQKYKGIGIAKPLVRMNMLSARGEHIGGNLDRRIKGRELLLEKHMVLYAQHPRELALLIFWLALWCRDAGQSEKAKQYFMKAFLLSKNPRYLFHWLYTCLKR